MGTAAIITIIVIIVALILFATEIIPVDLVAITIMVTLMLTGVITAEQGIAGFSNNATITVAFMFVLSDALLKTGALQHVSFQLSSIFRKDYKRGILLMMLLVAGLSAFINNTPIVAIFIPVVIQIAYASGQNPTKMLIPLSFATIMGGICTLIGTSTNILVSGIAEDRGLPAISMFEITPMGIIFLIAGIIYMYFIGIRLLPDRKKEDSLKAFQLDNYLTEVEILDGSELAGKQIMNSTLVQELEMDIIEVKRHDSRFRQPTGDFVLMVGDLLKIRCDVKKIQALKERMRIVNDASALLGESDWQGKETVLTEMVVTATSPFIGSTLRELDFRRTYRSTPLAIRHREEILHDNLYDVPLMAGDVLLADVKSHYIKELKQLEMEHEAPFVILSEQHLTDFNLRNVIIVATIILGVVVTASLEILPIVVATIAAVVLLALLKLMSMKEIYKSINWDIVFLLAGALSLGEAMKSSGLDLMIAEQLSNSLGGWGPIAIVSGLYLVTALITEIMSNNAAAALFTPIAIATAQSLDLSPTPFIMAVLFAASASFMTPIGYQTNTMVYSAGGYKFTDFTKVGWLLAITFWLLATFLIPVFYPF
jgi:di/tricarboxylate transporter